MLSRRKRRLLRPAACTTERVIAPLVGGRVRRHRRPRRAPSVMTTISDTQDAGAGRDCAQRRRQQRSPEATPTCPPATRTSLKYLTAVACEATARAAARARAKTARIVVVSASTGGRGEAEDKGSGRGLWFVRKAIKAGPKAAEERHTWGGPGEGVEDTLVGKGCGRGSSRHQHHGQHSRVRMSVEGAQRDGFRPWVGTLYSCNSAARATRHVLQSGSREAAPCRPSRCATLGHGVQKQLPHSSRHGSFSSPAHPTPFTASEDGSENSATRLDNSIGPQHRH